MAPACQTISAYGATSAQASGMEEESSASTTDTACLVALLSGIAERTSVRRGASAHCSGVRS